MGSRSAAMTCCLLIACYLSGCRQTNSLPTRYGRSRGYDGTQSINGTGLLAELFRIQGHDVSQWRRLSPYLNDKDILVWFDLQQQTPDAEQITFLEKWLSAKPGRTLLYVIRDYDAEIEYWQQIERSETTVNRDALRRHLAHLRAEYTSRRLGNREQLDCSWFRYLPHVSADSTPSLSGPWTVSAAQSSEPIDAIGAKVALTGTLKRGKVPGWQPLLRSDEDVLAARIRPARWQGSQVIVVANGSWLLNGAMALPPRRPLAMRVIRECSPARGDVCFLEPGPEGLPVRDSDYPRPVYLRALSVFPIGVILLQSLAAGLLFCFAVLPIFGTPKHLRGSHYGAGRHDFSRHLQAVGQLLIKNRNLQQARTWVEQYRATKEGVDE